LWGGREIGVEGAEGLKAARGAEATGDLLFDFGHTHRLFTEVIGEGDPGIGHEAPDIVSVAEQTIDEVERLALLGAAAFARR